MRSTSADAASSAPDASQPAPSQPDASQPPPPPGLDAPPTGDPYLHRTAAMLATLQDEIVNALQALEPDATFVRDDWSRDAPRSADDATGDNAAGDVAAGDNAPGDGPTLHGGGRTRVLEGGSVFERAGVNLSLVWGSFSPGFAAQMRLGDGQTFAAANTDSSHATF